MVGPFLFVFPKQLQPLQDDKLAKQRIFLYGWATWGLTRLIPYFLEARACAARGCCRGCLLHPLRASPVPGQSWPGFWIRPCRVVESLALR